MSEYNSVSVYSDILVERYFLYLEKSYEGKYTKIMMIFVLFVFRSGSEKIRKLA